MKHETIKGSTTIKSIAYDPAKKIMQVAFASGGMYELEDVEQKKFDAFQTAARDDEISTGKHFHANFKGQHKFKKL